MELTLIVCPYNSSHQFPPKRLMWHMLKCKNKSQYSLKTVTCPYDSSHVLEIDDIHEHMEKVCESKPKDPVAPTVQPRRPAEYQGHRQPRNRSSGARPQEGPKPRKRSADAVFVFVAEEQGEFNDAMFKVVLKRKSKQKECTSSIF